MNRHPRLASLTLITLVLVLLCGCGPSTSVDNYDSSGGSNSGSGGGGTLTGLGYTWETGVSGTTTGFRSICFGNNRWIAVGNGSGSGEIGESLDGKSWSLTQENSATYYSLDNVAYGNGTFVALSQLGILVSTDGLSWSPGSVTSPDSSTYPQGLTASVYGNGLWVAVDNLFFTEEGWGILTSTDGVSWNETILSGSYAQPTAITYGNGTYVIVGYGGLLLTSPDGANWTNRSFTTGQAMTGVTYAGGKFVAVANNGQILTAADATGQWTATSVSVNGFNAIGYGGGLFLAVGSVSGAQVYTSTDGANWTNATSYLPSTIVSSSLNGAAYGNSAFVVAGDSGVVAVSP